MPTEPPLNWAALSTILLDESMKNYSVKAPTFGEVYRNPCHMVTTFFGAGCITPAPGTWGSFAAWPVFWLMSQFLPSATIWAVIAATFVLGALMIPNSGRLLGKVDHGSIVIDEVVAVWIILMLIPQTFFWQLAGVAVFRVFDIVKLPPASTIDSLRQNGWTVMVDDLLAAAYALLVLFGAKEVLAWLA